MCDTVNRQPKQSIVNVVHYLLFPLKINDLKLVGMFAPAANLQSCMDAVFDGHCQDLSKASWTCIGCSTQTNPSEEAVSL